MCIDQAEELVANAASRTKVVAATEVPQQLLEKTAAQHRHLVELAASLITSGMDEAAIEAVIRQAIVSYERELVKAVIDLCGGSARERPETS